MSNLFLCNARGALSCLLNAHISLPPCISLVWKSSCISLLSVKWAWCDITDSLSWGLWESDRRKETRKSIGWRSETWGMCCTLAKYAKNSKQALLRQKIIHSTTGRQTQKKIELNVKQKKKLNRSMIWRESHSSNVNALRFPIEIRGWDEIEKN